MGCCYNKTKRTTPAITSGTVKQQHTVPVPPLKGKLKPTPLFNEIRKLCAIPSPDTHYKFKSLLSTGYFGLVHKAVRMLDREVSVAIKSIDKNKLDKPVESLTRELDILLSVEHPNIVKVYEYFDDGQYIYIVTEYCSGKNLLEQIASEDSFTENSASVYMNKVFRAVAHLHQLGICHRDLQPEHFIFANKEDSELKLVNFGLSNRYGTKFGRGISMDSCVRVSFYIAPEAIKGSFTESCDIWSCGVLMHVILTGDLPYAGGTDQDIMKNLLRGNLTGMTRGRKRASGTTLYAKNLLKKLLNGNPSARISAKEALKDQWLIKGIEFQSALKADVLVKLLKLKSNSKKHVRTMAVLAEHLTSKQCEGLKEKCLNVDTDKTGHITCSTLVNLLSQENLGITLKKLNFHGETLQVNYIELLNKTIELITSTAKQRAWWVFRLSDEGTGLVSKNSLVATLKKLGQAGVEEIVAEFRLETSGEFTYQQLVSNLD